VVIEYLPECRAQAREHLFVILLSAFKFLVLGFRQILIGDEIETANGVLIFPGAHVHGCPIEGRRIFGMLGDQKSDEFILRVETVIPPLLKPRAVSE
jgi:hypothetical protein